MEWVDPTPESIDALAQHISDHEHGVVTPDYTMGVECEASWIWNPPEGSMADDQLNFLLNKWRGLCGDLAMPPISAIDPVELGPALGFVMLLDVTPGAYDCRYRLYGTQISAQAGRDWTGYLVSEMNQITRAAVALFYRAGYRASYQRPMPMFTQHRSPSWLAASRWNRLVLPFSGEDGAVARFLVGNVPIELRYLSDEEEDALQRRLRPDQTK